MRRFVLGVVAGVLVEATLLVAVGGLSPHHPSASRTAFRLFAVGGVGGFVAATIADRAPHLAGLGAGASAGVVVGAAFWWLLFHGTTTGVFHHLHYAVASAALPDVLVDEVPRLVGASVSALVATVVAAGGFVGGVATVVEPIRP